MPIPKVTIVGRPNVGKSSIFNWLAGRRLAIVDDVAGVTRDRMTTLIEFQDRHFEIVDTGGMGIQDVDNLTEDVEAQITTGIEEADVIVFVVDTRAGIAPLDEFVADRLRKIDKPIILVANKSDDPKMDVQADEFRRLGRGWLVCVSTLQNRNRTELLELIEQRLPNFVATAEEVAPALMKVTVVGRRNVGKSTFVNTLAQAERMIVSEVAGTTRDSVDIHFDLDGQKFMAIDTPGLRKTKSVRTDIDFYGMHRAQRSIRRADVVLLFFDCAQRVSKVDKQLAQYIVDQYKPCILVVNKWDQMVGKMPTERWVRYLREQFPTMTYCPIAFVTGQTGKNIKTLLNHAQMLFKQANQKVSTPQLNRLIKAAVEQQEPPLYHFKRPKILYGTQITAGPPTIILVCNQAEGFTGPYQRYLLGFLRDHLPFGEVPIKLYLQNRSRSEAKAQSKRADATIDSPDTDLDADSDLDERNDLDEEMDRNADTDLHDDMDHQHDFDPDESVVEIDDVAKLEGDAEK